MSIRVLIAGEYSGTIRDAFIARGHDALSCDLSPTAAPGPHYQGNWWDIMFDGWDLIIFHPTCRWMANSGAKHLFNGMTKENGLNIERWVKMGQEAWELWNLLQSCPARFVAIENPVMLRYAQIMSGLEELPCQTVQPWWFGTDPTGPDNTKKATCWWTKGGLPKLERTGTLDGKSAREEVAFMTPTADPEERRMARSKFTPGHAAAIAKQWGDWVDKYKDTQIPDQGILALFSEKIELDL
ncbi:MAG TPA: hypothetical protein PK869_05050 [Candidatus Hydrogenedentes bacterium]|nr:hypothetical protein [Candidatus Hydrogenedentota bacterium]